MMDEIVWKITLFGTMAKYDWKIFRMKCRMAIRKAEMRHYEKIIAKLGGDE